MSNAGEYRNIQNIKDLKFTGFKSWGGSGTYYHVSGLTFYVDRPGNGYIKSQFVSWVGGQAVSLSLWLGQTIYVYMNPIGNIGATGTRSVALFQDNIVLFEVLTDSAGFPNVLVVKENHPYDFPTATSEWAHSTVGTVIDNSKNGANIALNGTKSIQINGQDVLLDHGLDTTIPDSGATAVNFNFMYTDSIGRWVLNTTQTTFPSDYNNAGTITALGTNKFGVFRLFVSKDDLNSPTPTYYTVYDDQQYNNLALAQAAIANNTPATATNEFFEIQVAQLGFIIKQESSDTIVSVIIQKSTVRGATTFATPTAASLINTDTSAFDSWLSASDTTVQAALNTLDDVGKGITIDPGAAGDSYVQFDVNTINEFRIGVDDDDADKFKISKGSSLGTNDTLIITNTGEITKPLQSAFLAYLSSTVTNVTGDGTTYKIICDTEVFDQNSDYDNTTGIFTAPVTGRYQFNFSVRSIGITIGHTNGRIQLITSNRTYTPIKLNYATGRTASDDLTESSSLLADMDAGDTAELDIQISNGTKVIDIAGAADAITYFSGALIC